MSGFGFKVQRLCLSRRVTVGPGWHSRRVVSWLEFAAHEPEFADEVRRRFAVRKHATLATVRRDGAPRISGSEVEFTDGDVFLGSMPGAVKALDLRRDNRFALHSPTVDPPQSDEGAWEGEAKLAGRGVEVSDPAAVGEPLRFRLDLTEVVFTRVVGGRLEVRSWHPGRGLETRYRD